MTSDWLSGTTATTRPALSSRKSDGTAVPALTILYHADLERLGDMLFLGELAAGRRAEISRARPVFTGADGRVQPLADPFISRKPMAFSNAPNGSVQLNPGGTAVLADGSPVTDARVFSSGEVARGVVLELADRVVLLLHMATTRRPTAESFGLIGESAAMARVRSDIERIADLDTSVLIRGETGTGKELVARAVHQYGARRSGPFVGANMGAVPASLAASELFGVERGAFTGADRTRNGLFQAAHRGTLFLDEIGEATPEIQVMLLRVLETKEVFPVGARQPRTVDIRLLAATDADLEAMSASGSFRAPLLHRLGGYRIQLPPLRERREDLGRLLGSFLRTEAHALGEAHRLAYRDPHATPWLPAPLAARLARYSWPGNVRELKNVISQLVIGSRGLDKIVPSPAIEDLLDDHGSEPWGKPEKKTKPSALSDDELLTALRRNRWEVKATAAHLGISRTSLHSRLEKCDRVRKAVELGPEELKRCRRDCNGDLDKMVDILEVSRAALARRLKELGIE
ncbi:MAG: sigma-54 dependent transcriptional regulator [Acidobacteriota bacterium]|nr:sigma-54 dependent transcriptional regulator [Acidobacteriota bacterium]